ncbi:MAG TPA: hypothetical protein VIR56_09930 [Solimonas sp.]
MNEVAFVCLLRTDGGIGADIFVAMRSVQSSVPIQCRARNVCALHAGSLQM